MRYPGTIDPFQTFCAEDWHEDIGDVLWWRVHGGSGQIREAPFCGDPRGSDWPYALDSDGDGRFGEFDEGDYLVWSRLPIVKLPGNAAAPGQVEEEARGGRFLTSVDDFQAQGAAWAERTFPTSTVSSTFAHLRKEMGEAEKDPADVVEFADCLILLLRACSLAGHSFSAVFAAARKKQLVNEEREWGQPDAQGVVEHVREERVSRITDVAAELAKEEAARREALDAAIANGDAR